MPLGLAVRGAKLGHKALFPSVETIHGMLFLWLMAQEGAGHYPMRPMTKSKYAWQLLLLDI